MKHSVKRFAALFLAALMALTVLTACGQAQQPQTPAEEPVTIRLGGLKGPTTIGMVKLLSDSEAGTAQNDYTFQLAGAADELTPLLLKGELDVVAVPANLAAVLYSKSEGAVQFLAINTLGVLYVVEKGGDAVTDWESLRGQTIYATGKGTTPEYTLTYLLAQHGLTLGTDVTVEWKSEPSEVVAQMAAEDHAIAMLPQPYVTVAQTKLDGLRVALDLTASWDELHNGSQCVTAGLVVRREFAKAHPQALASFLSEYAASTQYANDHVSETAQLVEQYDIVKAAVAEKAIPYCNIVCISGSDMVPALKGYLQVLFDQNPASVGGAMPGDDFYYVGA